MKSELSKPHKISKLSKILINTIIILLLTLLALSIIYSEKLLRLYTSITIYDEDKIVNNFMTLHERFSTTEIMASTQAYRFPVDIQPLPIQFTAGEETLLLDDFLSDTNTTGFIVIKNGRIVHETYRLGFAENKQHISWSVAKSFLSGLFGIAIEEGYIDSIEQSVTDYVPELIGSGYDGVRIKDVLQMSSGVLFNEDYSDFHSDINRFGRAFAFGQSLDDFSASLTRLRDPGTFNHYVSIDTQVLGMVLTRAINMSLSEYLQQKIWQPMGMEYPAYWLKDDQGMELALGGLNVALRDYAKFGWLYANKGRWQGQQIIPEAWVQASVNPDAPHVMPGLNNPQSSSSFGYGYQWWIPLGADDEFSAQGIYHQYIYIDPDQALVIVKTSANHKYNDRSQNWSVKHYSMFRAIEAHYRTPE